MCIAFSSLHECRAFLRFRMNVRWAYNALPAGQSDSRVNIAVFRLPAQVTDEDLRGIFSVFGPVLSARVLRDVVSGASREKGFVQFARASDALLARVFLRWGQKEANSCYAGITTQWAHQTHDTGFYGPRVDSGKTVFLRNIPADVDDGTIFGVVSAFGNVELLQTQDDTYSAAAHDETTESVAPNAETGDAAAAVVAEVVPSRIAHIHFTTAQAARAAVAALHACNVFHDSYGRVLMAKISAVRHRRPTKVVRQDSNEEVRHHLQSQQQQQPGLSEEVSSATPPSGELTPKMQLATETSTKGLVMMMVNTAAHTAPPPSAPFHHHHHHHLHHHHAWDGSVYANSTATFVERVARHLEWEHHRPAHLHCPPTFWAQQTSAAPSAAAAAVAVGAAAAAARRRPHFVVTPLPSSAVDLIREQVRPNVFRHAPYKFPVLPAEARLMH